MCMQKGAPILRLALRLALSCGLRLELTYRDPSVPERINELRKENQERAKAGLSTALAEHDSRRSQRMRTHILSLREGPDFDPDVCQLVAGDSRTRVDVRLGRVLFSRWRSAVSESTGPNADF
jgi:hypothetical protein